MTRPLLWPGAAALLLLIVICGEWIAGATRLGRMQTPPLAASSAAGHPGAAAETAAAPDSVDDWLRTALARPLLSASRAPAAQPGGPTISLTGGLPRLAGTIIDANSRTAIFARDDGGHPVVVKEGGAVGPYRITRIMPDTVTLDGPSGRQTLRPSFGARSALDSTTPMPLVQPNAPQPNFPGLVQQGQMPGQIPGQIPGQMQFPQQPFPQPSFQPNPNPQAGQQ